MTTTTAPIETNALFLPPQANPGQIEQCLKEFLQWEEGAERNRTVTVRCQRASAALPGASITEAQRELPQHRVTATASALQMEPAPVNFEEIL